jgi:hypothetical protein
VNGMDKCRDVGSEPRPDPDPVADLAQARARIDLTLLEEAAQLDAAADVVELSRWSQNTTSRE